MQQTSNNRTQKKKGMKRTVITSILMTIIISLSFVGGYFFNELSTPKDALTVRNIVSIIEKHGYILDPVTGEVREFTEKDYAKLLTDGLLDEYCKYYTAEERATNIRKSSGIYNGIGISLSNDSRAVFKVIGNSPAEKAGIKAGDQIIAGIKDDVRVEFSTGKEIMAFIDSLAESKFVTLVFEGEKTQVLEKAEYFVSYVTYYDSETRLSFVAKDDTLIKNSDQMSQVLDDDTAYIRLDQFEGEVANQFALALNFMKERGRKKLILDLRDNGGGYMNVLTDVASLIIKNQGQSKTLVAVAKGKTEEEKFYTNKNSFNDNVTAISVIANENTASASECLIGAMLNYGDFFSVDRLIIERNKSGTARTYGKGIMQTTYSFMDGSALKLTTANIYWPDGSTCIHGKGITTTTQNSVEKGVYAIMRAQAKLN